MAAVKPLNLKTLSEVSPDSLYSAAHVANLVQVSPKTIREWIRAGKLGQVKHPITGRWMVAGSALLMLVGPLLASLPQLRTRTETPAERKRRADRAIEGIK